MFKMESLKCAFEFAVMTRLAILMSISLDVTFIIINVISSDILTAYRHLEEIL